MQILIPSIESKLHPYLKEISLFSKNKFVNCDLDADKDQFRIINIHWPEAIFGWLEPSHKQLDSLEGQIKEWKKTARLVYTKHDYLRNKGTTRKFSRLFRIIEENSDAFIHLGEYSKAIYQKLYPKAFHKVIPHPLFENTFNTVPKEAARNILGIDKSSLVIIVPGQIRSRRERNLILKAFKSLKLDKGLKVLIATNMRTELLFDFPGRTRIKSIFDFQKYFKDRFKNKHQPPTYFFNYSHLKETEYGLKVSASDLVLIPRIDSLNSGNIFLGLTFNKIIVGPAIGNMTEVLSENGLPVFDPNSDKSIKSALEKGIKMFYSNKFKFPGREKYQPKKIAKEYDKFFKSLI